MNPHPWIAPQWAVPRHVRSLITTRSGGVSEGAYASLNLGTHVGDDPARVARNRARVREFLPADPLWLEQVHGTRVVQAGRDAPHAQARTGEPASGRIEADAAVTRTPGEVLVIMTADCLPVLLADGAGEAVGIAHAGWRGLADGVIENTVRAMGVPASRILAYLGPAIGPQSYEVGEDVRSAFLARDPQACDGFMPREGRQFAGKYLADLYGLARRRLRALGITDIAGGERCTLRESADFFSFRRDRTTGRMASFIWMEKQA